MANFAQRTISDFRGKLTSGGVRSNLFEVLETYFSRRLIINFANNPLRKRNKKKIRRAIIISEIFIPEIPFFQTSINNSINSSVLSIFNLFYF